MIFLCICTESLVVWSLILVHLLSLTVLLVLLSQKPSHVLQKLKTRVWLSWLAVVLCVDYLYEYFLNFIDRMISSYEYLSWSSGDNPYKHRGVFFQCIATMSNSSRPRLVFRNGGRRDVVGSRRCHERRVAVHFRRCLHPHSLDGQFIILVRRRSGNFPFFV